jgi:hypothetical protein
VVIAVLLLALFAFGSFLVPLSSIGGFQGQAYAVQGVDFAGSNVPTGSALPSALSSSNGCGQFVGGFIPGLGSTVCSWSWADSSLTNPELHVTASDTGAAATLDVSYSTSQPVAQCAAGNLITKFGASPCPSISLYVTAPNGTKVHEYGWIVSYTFGANVVASGSSTAPYGHLQYQGVSWVNQIASFYWPNAYSDPLNSSWEGRVFQAPLQLQISSCTTGSTGPGGIQSQPCSANNPPANDVLDPMSAGSQAQLYTDPQITGSWNDIACTIAGDTLAQCASQVSSSINGVVSPSSDFHEGPTYFPVTMQNFGTYDCGTLGTGLCASFTDLRFTLYTVLMGSYIPNTTSPITQTISANGGGSSGGCSTGTSNFFGFCTSPSELNLLVFIVIAMAVLIALAYVLPYAFALRGVRRRI